jgi:hypothetical protein
LHKDFRGIGEMASFHRIDKDHNESIILLSTVAIALLIMVGGVWLAFRFEDAHWVNRSGALIVVVESIIVFVEASRESRLEKMEHIIGDISKKSEMDLVAFDGNQNRIWRDAVRRRANALRRELIIIGVGLAAFGEIIHGFGDLAFGLFFSVGGSGGH